MHQPSGPDQHPCHSYQALDRWAAAAVPRMHELLQGGNLMAAAQTPTTRDHLPHYIPCLQQRRGMAEHTASISHPVADHLGFTCVCCCRTAT